MCGRGGVLQRGEGGEAGCMGERGSPAEGGGGSVWRECVAGGGDGRVGRKAWERWGGWSNGGNGAVHIFRSYTSQGLYTPSGPIHIFRAYTHLRGYTLLQGLYTSSGAITSSGAMRIFRR